MTTMTYAEVQKAVSDLIASPETAQTAAIALLDNLKADYDTLESLTAAAKASEDRIRALQDTNQRLFLMQTGQVKDEAQDDELTGIEAVDAFVANIMSQED